MANSPYIETSGGTPTGSLIDGIYIATLDPSKVTTTGGGTLAAGGSLTFHRLFGDVNGNGSVNALDYNQFRGAFGKSTGADGFNDAFDFDGSQSINALDYNQFRRAVREGVPVHAVAICGTGRRERRHP